MTVVSDVDRQRAVTKFGLNDFLQPRTTAKPLLAAQELGGSRWLAERRFAVGASEMAAVLGVSPHASPFSLWWAKTEGWDIETTEAMRIGTKLEPVIGELFAERHPDMVLCRPAAALYGHFHYGHMVCTPDFLALAPVVDEDYGVTGFTVIPVECKSDQTQAGWGADGSDVVPAHHRVQALCQAGIFGSSQAIVAHLAGKHYTEHPLSPDSVEWRSWVQRARDFIDSIGANLPPSVDGHEATTATLIALEPKVDPDEEREIPADLTARYHTLVEMLRADRQALRRVSNEVRNLLGTAGKGVTADGDVVVRREVYARRGFTVRPTTVDRLVPRRLATSGLEVN